MTDSLIKVFDLPGQCWPKLVDHGPQIDRSSKTVDEFWTELGVQFVNHPSKADLIVRKAELGLATDAFFSLERETAKRLAGHPYVLFIGEPRELAAPAYRYADPTRTLAVAPGDSFERMHFGRPWSDPQLESWNKRLDRFVWIGRPIGHRLRIAKQLVDMGLPLDIYSREPWPLDCWKGPAADDVETGRAYKYRIACENSDTHLYHSEKLFTALRSGCVTFYWGDPALDLSFAKGAFLPLNPESLNGRAELSADVLEGMNRFMFSNSWEIYSIRSFIESAHSFFRKTLLSPRRTASELLKV